jgi:HD-GYP domain-containing protein (c-di-GMP phosphodiesterase class II)
MGQPPQRLAKLVATLSITADLGTGHPLERALRACLLALGIGEALRAVADFVDLRLPMMSRHSTAVATLCVQAGARLSLGDAELTALRRAAYLHDLGAASVSVWEKAGPLNADEWERVRLHP